MSAIYPLYLKALGINTHKEAVVYMREDCPVCYSEGFEAQARIQVTHKNGTIMATLNTIESDLLKPNEVGLSTFAWESLGAKEGDEIQVAHPIPPESLSFIRSKIFGHELNKADYDIIIKDLVAGYLSDIHISAFIAACGNGRLSKKEIAYLTQSMIEAGEQLSWPSSLVVDKHCVGGLPGNRTTLIVVPIITAFGLTMPKTSSRSITSPAGTADTMEVLAPVNLDVKAMRKVVEKENGCIVWGGSVSLSPADDLLIRIERALIIDIEGQLVASILSKKIAAGATHILIDIPVGPTAKVRTTAAGASLKNLLESIGQELGVNVQAVITDGLQPVGRGIGPALEAKDALAVLQNQPQAPQDLRDRSLMLAGHMLEFSGQVPMGQGIKVAEHILISGKAWEKFQAICYAQGGLSSIPTAKYTHAVYASHAGEVIAIDNRYLTRVAKLAGAPSAKAAGVELLTPLGTKVEKNQPLFIIHAENRGELAYAKEYLKKGLEIIHITEKK